MTRWCVFNSIVCFLYSIIINMEGAEGTLYSGERYRVSFRFTEKYPFDSPGVSLRVYCLHVFVCLFVSESVRKDMDNLSLKPLPFILYARSPKSLPSLSTPTHPTQVVFLAPSIPVHPHVYANGHICLSILADDWSPALTVLSICVSLQSMLSSCSQKQRPPDNDMYVRFGSSDPKRTKWIFHGEHIDI